MSDRFQEAFEAVEGIWDYDRRSLLDGVTDDDIMRALSVLNGMDTMSLSAAQKDMLRLLYATLKEARREYIERGETSDNRRDFRIFVTDQERDSALNLRKGIASAVPSRGLSNAVKRTIEKVNSPETGLPAADQMSDEFAEDSAKASELSLAEIIASQAESDDEEQEPVLDADHDFILGDEEIETADPEEELGDALGTEGLDRYNQEVWDKIEEKKERQRKRAEEKKRTDRWLRRFRARQAAEREAKEKREADSKAIEEQNEAARRRAEESARGVALYQRKQRLYDSKKAHEEYERETTRKHMAEREELRLKALDKKREEEKRNHDANRERAARAQEDRPGTDQDHDKQQIHDGQDGKKEYDSQSLSERVVHDYDRRNPSSFSGYRNKEKEIISDTQKQDRDTTRKYPDYRSCDPAKEQGRENRQDGHGKYDESVNRDAGRWESRSEPQPESISAYKKTDQIRESHSEESGIHGQTFFMANGRNPADGTGTSVGEGRKHTGNDISVSAVSAAYGRSESEDRKERMREEYEARKAEEAARNAERIRNLQRQAEEQRKSAARFREEYFGPEKVKDGPGLRGNYSSSGQKDIYEPSGYSDPSYHTDYGNRGGNSEGIHRAGERLPSGDRYRRTENIRQTEGQGDSSFSEGKGWKATRSNPAAEAGPGSDAGRMESSADGYGLPVPGSMPGGKLQRETHSQGDSVIDHQVPTWKTMDSGFEEQEEQRDITDAKRSEDRKREERNAAGSFGQELQSKREQSSPDRSAYEKNYRGEAENAGGGNTDSDRGLGKSVYSARAGGWEERGKASFGDTRRSRPEDSDHGTGGLSDSYYEQDKHDRMEADLDADKAARKAENEARVQQMGRDARERAAKAEAFAETRHSGIQHEQESVKKHKTIVGNTAESETGPVSLPGHSSGIQSKDAGREVMPSLSDGSDIRLSSSRPEGGIAEDIHHYQTAAQRSVQRESRKQSFGSVYGNNIRDGYGKTKKTVACMADGRDLPQSRGGIIYNKPSLSRTKRQKAVGIFLTPIGGAAYIAEKMKNGSWRDAELETAQEELARELAESSHENDGRIHIRKSTFDRETGAYVQTQTDGRRRITGRIGRKGADSVIIGNGEEILNESLMHETAGEGIRIKGKNVKESSEKTEILKKTPFERYVGQTFAVKTGMRFSDSASVRFRRIGRKAAAVPVSLMTRTEAGKGIRKVSKSMHYAGGAIAAAGAVGSFVSSTVILVGSTGSFASYGIRFFKGKEGAKVSIDSVQSAVEEKIGIAKGAHAISFSERKINQRIRELRRRYPAGKSPDGREVPDLMDRFTIVRRIRGKQIETIDLKHVNANIWEIERAVRRGKATKQMLSDLEGLKELKGIARSSVFKANSGKFMRRFGRALRAGGAAVTAMIGSSDNASMRGLVTAYQTIGIARSTVKLAVRTGKAGYSVGKLVLNTKPAKTAGRKMKKAGKKAGKELLTHAGIDYNSVHAAKVRYITRLRSELNGGIYNRVSESGIGRVTTRIGEGTGKAIRKAVKPLRPVKKAAARMANGVRRVTGAAARPFKLFGAVMAKLTSGVRVLVKWAAIILGMICLALFLFMIIGTFFIGFTQMIDTDTENLQNYVDYIAEQNRDWFDGKLEDSRADVGGTQMSLNEVYARGGSGKGKYRIVTTNFVDKYGRKVDSSDNIKEILAMVSVKTINTWPDNWDLVDMPWGADKWTVNEVKDIIRHLYAASHSWEAVEKGPYVYYKELNDKDVRILKPYAADEYRQTYYPSDFESKTLLGDAEGEACEGPRAFFCTEESGPETASEYRKEMDASYSARGGCEVDYSGYGTYDAVSDVLTLDGCLHDGTRLMDDAGAQIWANTDIRRRRQKAEEYENAKNNGSRVSAPGDSNAYIISGSGDELKPAHGLDPFSMVAEDLKEAPSGWIHYDREFSKYTHGDSAGYMGNSAADECCDYRRVYEGTVHGTTVGYYYTDCRECTITNEYGIGIWGGTAFDNVMTSYSGNYWAEFVWDTDRQKYKSAQSFDGGYIYVIDDGYRYHSRTGNSTLWFIYNSQFDCWIPNAGTNTYACTEPRYGYYCKERLYNYTCHDYEAYCSGHRERAVIYYCPGHEEYWCDGDHYDLDIEIRIHHIPELFYTDVNNGYSYKRKAVAVGEYPEGFDKLMEDGDDDFYWDRENRDQASIISKSKWTELYDGISGVDDVDVELDEEMLAKYAEYVDCPRIAVWKDGKPYGYDGNLIEISSRGGKWFFDTARGQYVKVSVRKSIWHRDARVYTIQETASVSPSKVSEQRRNLILNALSCVGVIPYQEDGEPGNHTGISDFGWTETEEGNGEVACGLNSGGFVNFIFRYSGYTIGGGNTGQIVKIWENTDEIGNRSSVTEKDLRPGDLGFINSYDDRLNPMVEQTEEDIIPYNTVGIFMGTNELGQRIWIQCSKTTQTVTVTTTNNFNYFRRPKGLD